MIQIKDDRHHHHFLHHRIRCLRLPKRPPLIKHLGTRPEQTFLPQRKRLLPIAQSYRIRDPPHQRRHLIGPEPLHIHQRRIGLVVPRIKPLHFPGWTHLHDIRQLLGQVTDAAFRNLDVFQKRVHDLETLSHIHHILALEIAAAVAHSGLGIEDVHGQILKHVEVLDDLLVDVLGPLLELADRGEARQTMRYTNAARRRLVAPSIADRTVATS